LSVASLTLLASYLGAEPNFSDWSAPVNLGSTVNSASRDAAPAISKNGLSLYFTSNRPGGFGGVDIWVSQRNSEEEPWGTPVNLGALINTATNDSSPTLSRDGHRLFFQSTRNGGFGGLDLWASYREHAHDDFDWQTPVNLGGVVNSAFEDTDAEFFQNDDSGVTQLFFSSNRPGGIGAFDFYVSQLTAEGAFGPPTLVAELSSIATDPGLKIRFDGLEVFLFSARAAGFGGQDLWTATRETVLDPWSTPVNLGPLVNSADGEQRPSIASDRQTLYFGSNRPVGAGDFDLYVTTRSKENRKGKP
jgi:hypothetical protein